MIRSTELRLSTVRTYQPRDGKHPIPNRKSGGEGFGILPSISGYVRYAAGRIKKEGLETIRIARLRSTCTEKWAIRGLHVLFPRGVFLYIAF
jgi:hypothetical protein